MITAYTGPNGAGKTLFAVDSLLQRRRRNAGREMWSTVEVKVGDEVITKPITDWDQLMRVKDADVLLDEVATLASGRETMTLPPQVIAWMSSLRHRNVTVTWTSPAWMDADVKLRQVTQVCYLVRPVIRGKRKDGELWRPTLVASVRAFDTTGRGGEPPTSDDRSGSLRIIRVRGCKAFGTYDTYAEVTRLTEFGSYCPKCGGVKRRPICHCP